VRSIAIIPGKAGSLQAHDLARPRLDDVPEGRGVRVRVLEVGLCGTDAELASGHFGVAPDGDLHLVIGHESLGQVMETGPDVDPPLRPGQFVVGTVRRPGDSEYDRAGLFDLSTDPDVHERGVRRLHGYLAEEYVEAAEFLVPVPDRTAAVAVLTEPMSGVGKALRVAGEIQRRLGIWQPRRVLVTGAGTVGLLAVLTMRMRGAEVTCWSRRPAPYPNSELAELAGARYVSAGDQDLEATVAEHGPFDIVFEASGAAAVIFPAADAVAINGILVLFGLTPGRQVVKVDVARFNQAFVLDNKALVGSVTATWQDYADAVADLGRAEADPAFTGFLPAMLRSRIDGLDVDAIGRRLEGSRDGIKTVVDLGRLR
jgi:threonine dehydrogenase-like Zn-dependent dehydrogenase